ncbi:hypothetical protein Maq22A_c28320 [Methylobacterium aquaticum]|uniref:Uncharacterized protein n=1 Tax=Methylobacterium aquaticum TaxID=270351 RepID=A0A1Y0ZBU4_9HYPH|nr:hypothetical protein Maq22A_c28320 [Methylobacterium aquaticum]
MRIPKSLRVTPAMAAVVNGRLWSMDDIAALVDAAAPTPGKCGTYKQKDV